MAWIAKEFNSLKTVKGLSEKQINEHYNVLYKGYVNKINEIEEKLKKANLSDANATYSEVRELKREQVFATNAIRLHEEYFNCLGGQGGTATNQALDLITQDFGSFENWKNDFIATCMSARGWTVLGFDCNDSCKLHNYSIDIHSDGIWGCIPLVVCDVYEHAYFIDFATARKSYLDTYFQNINWNYVNSIIENMGLIQMRMAA